MLSAALLIFFGGSVWAFDIWTSELFAGILVVFAALAAMTCGFHDARPYTPIVWYVRPCRRVGKRRLRVPKRYVLQTPLAVLTRLPVDASALSSGELHKS